MVDVCYLCGKEIVDQISKDHVVPKQFIKRSQPKTKGFESLGKLPTHPKCNNRFGPEKMCQKSLKLLSLLYNPQNFAVIKGNQHAEIVALNADLLKEFSPSDLKFFKIHDARKDNAKDIIDPNYLKNKKPTNIIKQITNIALSVLVKSAVAVLIARFGISLTNYWRILAIPYGGDLESLDFDHEPIRMAHGSGNKHMLY